MDDGDKEGLYTALHSDPRFIVATTLASLVLAGSVYIWRSNPKLLLLDSHQRGEYTRRDPDSRVTTSDKISPGSESFNIGSSSKAAAGTALTASDDLASQSDAKDSKNSRPKERRRRGKDPLKEILKSGKKLRKTTKSGRVDDANDSGVGPSTTFLQTRESTRFSHSHELSLATSSRSGVTISNPNRRPNSDWASSQGDEDESVPSSSTPIVSRSLAVGSENSSSVLEPSTSRTSGPSSLSQDSDSDAPLQPQTPEFPNISLSASSSASHSSSIFSSESIITSNTSPTLSLSDKTPTLPQIESSPPLPPRAPPDTILNSVSPSLIPQAQRIPGPWNPDGTSRTPPSDTFHKPPRFRPTSKTPAPTQMFPSASSPIYSAEPGSAASFGNTSLSSSPVVSFGTAALHDDPSVPLTFPTLNSAPSLLPSTPASPEANRISSNSSSTASGNGNGNIYGNGNTPKRVSTPGTNTPPLSAQTQLASLRGALEAARMREEKTKTEIERYSKDIEMMRWEGAAARRREVELQAQIHHLMHQLQSYATAFASMSGHPSPIPLHHNAPGNSNVNGVSNTTQNGYQFPSSPPTHLHIPSTAQMLLTNGILSPNMLSPMSMSHSGPLSPFYTYPSHPPHGHNSHTHPHPQSQSPHQPNLYSTPFPHAPGTSVTGSRPSSVAGSSSVGSHSPDLTGSPTPSPALVDRGRRRTRRKIKTACTRIGEHDGEREGDTSVNIVDDTDLSGERDTPDEYGDGDNEDEDDDEEVNEVLAGAILKRPESIRNLSSSKRGKAKDRDEVQEQTEFTFPSLSNFGNVARKHGGPTEALSNGKGDSDIREDNEESHIKSKDPEKTVEPLPSSVELLDAEE